jgi:hypothetical protein
MGEDIALIWPSVKAKYFLFLGLTQFTKTGSDLPVGLIGHMRLNPPYELAHAFFDYSLIYLTATNTPRLDLHLKAKPSMSGITL